MRRPVAAWGYYAPAMVLPREVEELIQPEQDTVYHYTDANGLLKILESNELRATESHGMNDVAEIKQGWRFIRDWLRSREPHDPTVTDLIAAAGTRNDDYGYTYFCCASLTADDANQWRNYADGGRGFSIALEAAPAYDVVTETAPPEPPTDPDALGRRIAGWTEFLNSYEATPWLKVLYEKEDKERVLDAYLASARAAREALDPTKFDEDEWSLARTELLDEYRADLEALARLMKAPGFAGEREVRLVVSTFGSRYASLRTGRYGITMYQRLALSDGGEAKPFRAPRYGIKVGKSGGRLPVTAVWCGPLVSRETNARAIGALLSRGDHEGVQIEASAVPLR